MFSLYIFVYIQGGPPRSVNGSERRERYVAGGVSDGTASSAASSAALSAEVASLRTALRRHEEESRRELRRLRTVEERAVPASVEIE